MSAFYALTELNKQTWIPQHLIVIAITVFWDFQQRGCIMQSAIKPEGVEFIILLSFRPGLYYWDRIYVSMSASCMEISIWLYTLRESATQSKPESIGHRKWKSLRVETKREFCFLFSLASSAYGSYGWKVLDMISEISLYKILLFTLERRPLIKPTEEGSPHLCPIFPGMLNRHDFASTNQHSSGSLTNSIIDTLVTHTLTDLHRDS